MCIVALLAQSFTLLDFQVDRCYAQIITALDLGFQPRGLCCIKVEHKLPHDSNAVAHTGGLGPPAQAAR